MPKIVVAVSGGMDSVTMLYCLKDQGHDLYAYSFFMKSKHNDREIPFAAYHCKKLGVPHQVIDISFINDLFKSDLLQSGGKIPQGMYDQDNMKRTVIPFRNGIMLSILAGIADSIGASKVALGSHAGDHAIYPDCRPAFNVPFEHAVKAGTFNKIGFVRPFQNITKTEVGRIGLKLGINYAKTWSCYEGKSRPCLRCGTCTERTEVFMELGIQDPLLTISEWNRAWKYYRGLKKVAKSE